MIAVRRSLSTDRPDVVFEVKPYVLALLSMLYRRCWSKFDCMEKSNLGLDKLEPTTDADRNKEITEE